MTKVRILHSLVFAAITLIGMARPGVAADLGPDGCTFYYSGEGPGIKRFDVCGNRALPDFTTIAIPNPGSIREFAVLGDGSLLIANTTVIVRVDAVGNLLGTFDAPGNNCWNDVSIAADRRTFWATSSCDATMAQFDLATGSALQTFAAGDANVSAHARIFGGGTEFTSTGAQVNHGMDLHCDSALAPNSLQVVWGGNTFFLQNVTSSSCIDDPSVASGASFDTHSGSGTGTLNGQAGFSAEWSLTDAGPVGVGRDGARIVIRSPNGQVVLEVSGKIYGGSQTATDTEAPRFGF